VRESSSQKVGVVVVVGLNIAIVESLQPSIASVSGKSFKSLEKVRNKHFFISSFYQRQDIRLLNV